MAVITVSRGTLSGGQRLAECVCERLGYRCLSREGLVEAAKRYDIPEQTLNDALTKKPGLLQSLTRERAHYLTCIRAALVREARDEKVVYHGHAGHLLLTGVPHLLRIRVVAGMEFRIKAAMNRLHLSREEAIEHIKRVDKERVEWTKFLYHVNWSDPSLYDLVVNLDRLDMADACDIVCRTAALNEFQATTESQRVMADLVLSTEVRATIAVSAARKKDFVDAGVEIQANGGVVTIGGTIASLEDADKIREIVEAVPGVSGVNSKETVWPSW